MPSVELLAMGLPLHPGLTHPEHNLLATAVTIGPATVERVLSFGDAVVGPAEAADFPTWLAGFMLTGPSSKHAIKRAHEVNDDIVRRVRLKASA